MRMIPLTCFNFRQGAEGGTDLAQAGLFVTFQPSEERGKATTQE